MPDPSFWRGKKVFVTGHTGFMGSWLSLWLAELGAELFGYGLGEPTSPALYSLCGLDRAFPSATGDIRDGARLSASMAAFGPDIVFHLAGQPHATAGFERPAETFEANAVGTARTLDGVLASGTVRAVVVVTSDRCYAAPEGGEGLREGDPLGGADPYLASAACAELVAAAYRRSFFGAGSGRPAAVATARAGDAIGGGDFAAGRLVPDCVRAWRAGRPPRLRRLEAVRPWQHVLEPLGGCLALAEALWRGGDSFAEAWNFGPPSGRSRTAGWLAAELAARLGPSPAAAAGAAGAAGAVGGSGPAADAPPREGARSQPRKAPREASPPRLDSGKAARRLGWRPLWTAERALDLTAEWYRAWAAGEDAREASLAQIALYAARLRGPADMAT